MIVADPRLDHQCLNEASYMNIPVIALCDTDSPLNWVDVAVPCNNKGIEAIAYTTWLLAREVLQLRAEVSREGDWDVIVDLFMYREPQKEVKNEDKVEADAEDAENAEEEVVQTGVAGVFAGEEGSGDEEEMEAFGTGEKVEADYAA